MLNSLWLKTFKTLVEIGHFTQTAQKLNMTQPGVSQHIKKLESSCGYSLIKRENKGFELTIEGKMIYEYSQKLAREEAKLIEKLSFDSPYSGKTLLSCSGSLALLLYPKLLALQEEHTELSIFLEAAPNEKIFNDLQSGVIDLGIVTKLPNSSFYQSEVIGSEPLCLVLPSSYKGEKITKEQLFNLGLIEHPDAMHYLSIYVDLCGEKDLAFMDLNNLPRSGYINQINQILLPVSKGLGFTILPKSAVENFQSCDELYIAKPSKKVEEILYLVQKRSRDLPKRYQTIGDLLGTILL